MKAPRALACLSRHRCTDLGQIIGTTDEVLSQVRKRASKAQKPFAVKLIGLDYTDRTTGEKESWIAQPGGELQQLAFDEPETGSIN